MATGRGFSTAGIGPARITRSVSFYDQNNADRDVWAAWWWSGPSLPPITGNGSVTLDAVTSAGAGSPVVNGTGAVTLDGATSSGAGAPVIVGTGAVTLGSLTSAGSGTSGSSGVPSSLRHVRPARRGAFIPRGLYAGRRR